MPMGEVNRSRPQEIAVLITGFGAKLFHKISLLATHLNDEQKVAFLHNLLGCLNDNGQILIGDVAFETREELNQFRQSARNEWDDDEFYFVADELRSEFPRLSFAPLSYCAGVLSLPR